MTAGRTNILHIRVFFAHNGPGPFECFACEEEVALDEVFVHHRDHDPSNNDPANLAPAHQSCHNRYHKSEWWAAMSPEERREAIQPMRGGAERHLASLSPQERSARARHANSFLSPEQKRERAKKALAARWAGPRATHCINGHAFDEENTRITNKGHRQCRQCVRDSGARYRQRRRERVAA